MAPYHIEPAYSNAFPVHSLLQRDGPSNNSAPITKPTDASGLILEAWAQGYMVGSLIIMAAITVANMRKGALLHKLILLELILGTFHGTFIFTNAPVYGWYLSVTAIFLNISWSLHNVIAWMKTKPFLSKRWSLVYIGTVILAQPYWVLEIYANFAYFNNINRLFERTRPYEALCRDPWWIFSTVNLFYNITVSYHLPLITVIRLSPRFAILLLAMTLSVCFIIVDIISVTDVLKSHLPDGLNPFWKLAFVFKCLTDSIILDDFKTALDKLMQFKMQREQFGTLDNTGGATFGSDSSANGDACWNLAEGTTTAAEGGFLKRGSNRTTFPADPLSEETMEQERADGAQATAGRTMTFEQMLRADRVGGGQRGSDGSSTNKAMVQHIDHWDKINLPDFETDSASASDENRKRSPS